MACSRDFHDFVMDQLHGLGELRSRKMFGEYGIYCDDLFFAIAADESLWFKVDAQTRPRFEKAGMRAFAPGNPPMPMQYYEVPLEVLEEPALLREWATEALEVARRAPKKKRKR